MRFVRAAVLVTILGVVPLLAVTLLRARACQTPEVRLSRLVRLQPELSENDSADSSFFRIDGVESETWRAELEIRAAPGTGVVLTNGEIGVEILGLHGDWTAMAASSAPVLPAGLRLQFTTRTVRILLPERTRSCRFSVGFRPATLRERGLIVLRKSGLPRRFPWLSAWISGRLPTTEHWLEYRGEVQLPAFPIEQEAPHSSPQLPVFWKEIFAGVELEPPVPSFPRAAGNKGRSPTRA